MLSFPTSSLARTTNIVGIDPGSETLGLSVIEIDIDTLQIVKSSACTFVGSKMFDDSSWLATSHSNRVARIAAHKQNLVYQLRKIDPICIACESPFYNPRRPNAYGVLVEVLTMIRDAVIEYDVWKTLYLIDPPTVKKSVGAAGNADKIKMLEAVINLKSLNLNCDPSSLDEHSIDALAVAYCRYRQLTNSIF